MSEPTNLFSIPTRLRVSPDQRAMLDDLETFWGADTSSVIRKAITDQHTLLLAFRAGREPFDFECERRHRGLIEQYERRIAELQAQRIALLGADSPLLVNAR